MKVLFGKSKWPNIGQIIFLTNQNESSSKSKSFMIANRKKIEIRKLRFFFGNHNCQTIEALNGWRKLNYNEFAKMRMNSVFCK